MHLPSTAAAPATGYRLDGSFLPTHYDVALTASPKRSQFTGEVHVAGTLQRAQASVVLHARGLKIERAEVRQEGGRTQVAKVRYHRGTEQVELHVGEALHRGTAELRLTYSGKLAQSMHGLYLAKDGPEVALVTQCEASDARAIFPCLDEPAFKASLQWTITTDQGLTVLTNGRPLGGPTTQGKSATHRFAKTAPMSTYLAALTIGALEPGAHGKVSGVDCRTWAGRNKADQTHFAHEVTAKVLPYYVDYFDEPYAYDKLDQVAVPGFDAGAMENAGAIFYRQSLLLSARGQAGFAARKRIGEVIAHEIAHQWFGNLVTMQWWDDLWLNEAFATWIAFKSCNALFPAWHIWHDYLEAKEAALTADALDTTHPIYAEVKTPAEATELFDVITYEKGCGVLRMAEGYLGENAFRKGIRGYVKAHRFGNARGQDLWDALAAAAKQPVAALMQSWVTQSGFPLLRCERKGKSGVAAHTLVFEQRRFTAAPNAPASDAQWLVPMVVAYDAGKGVQQHRVLLEGRRQEVVLPVPAGQKLRWAYPNWDARGFWRCQLDAWLHGAVCAAGPEALGTGASMAMVYDAWALLRAGAIDVDAAMQTFAAFASAPDPAVFRAVAGRLRALMRQVVAPADRPRLAALAAKLARPHLERLGWTPPPGESPHDGVLRCAAIELLGHVARDPDVLARARALQAQEQQAPAAIDPNLAGTVVALSALGADGARLEELLATYAARKRAGASPEVQGRYLTALCCADQPEAVRAVLAATLDGTVPQEQLRTVLASLIGGREAGPIAWAFLTAHWGALSPKVGAMGIARLVEATGALPYRMRTELRAFFAAHPIPEAERAVRKSAEAMALWQGLRRRTSAALGDWLRAHAPAAGGRRARSAAGGRAGAKGGEAPAPQTSSRRSVAGKAAKMTASPKAGGKRRAKAKAKPAAAKAQPATARAKVVPRKRSAEAAKEVEPRRTARDAAAKPASNGSQSNRSPKQAKASAGAKARTKVAPKARVEAKGIAARAGQPGNKPGARGTPRQRR